MKKARILNPLQVDTLRMKTEMVHPEGAPQYRDCGDCVVRAIALAWDTSYDWALSELSEFQEYDASDGFYNEFIGWFLWENGGWDTYEFYDGYNFGEFVFDGFFDGLYSGLINPAKDKWVKHQTAVISIVDDDGSGHATCIKDGKVLDAKMLWDSNWRIHRITIDPRVAPELVRRMKARDVDYFRPNYKGRNKPTWLKKWFGCLYDYNQG